MLLTFRKMMDLLDARERRRFWLLMVLVLVMGVVNMAGVGSVFPFLAVLADPDIVQRNTWLSRLHELSGSPAPMDFLVRLGVGVLLAYALGVAFQAGVTYALLRYGAMRGHSLARRMLGAYLAQPYVWFLRRHSADLAKNVLAEVGQVVGQVVTPALRIVAQSAIVLFLLALLIAVNPLVALFLALLLGGSYAVIYILLRPRISRLGAARVAANKERFRIAQEGLGGIKEVKVLGLEASLLNRFEAPSRRMAETMATSGAVNELPRYLLEVLAFGGMIAVVLAVAVLNDGRLDDILPVAGIYALAGSRMAPAMQQVYHNLAALRFGRAALDALHADLMAAPAHAGPPAPPIHLRERLTLEGVTYTYPGAERGALDGLSLEIPVNSTVGVVGGTGAGKTTVIDVIMGLLEPQAGTLHVDGRPIETDADRRAWRRSIGYVPQQIFLVDDTVAANIAFGLPADKIDHAAVERAARMAQLHRFVEEELPQGYATRVGDRGVRLSGGQRQRIGIARALYHDPDVLVLDEATSALDNITEREVMEAVTRLGGAKTVVMIAHRLSTVEKCDKIFLLEHGRVAARGSYGQLLQRSPAFRAMAGGKAA